MIWLFFAAVFVSGALIAMQAGVNSQLVRFVGHPLLAATVSFVVGTLALALCAFGVGTWPRLTSLIEAPWWVWTGGLLGAVFVVTTAALAPTLGAATLLSIAVAGQMTFALLLDHYGLVGFAVRPLSVWRVVGAAFVVTGVVLIRRC
jgi:bacterial/archaeal transporter family-2 protein